jgi:hypothetical protein
MIFWDFDIFLSVLYHFLGQIVMQAGEEMESYNEPASRFIVIFELAHSALDQLLLKFVKFLAAVKRVGLKAKLFAY